MIYIGLITEPMTAHFRRNSVIPSFFHIKWASQRNNYSVLGDSAQSCLLPLPTSSPWIYCIVSKNPDFGGFLSLEKLFFGNLPGWLREGMTPHSSILTMTWCFNQAFPRTNRITTTPGFHLLRTSWNKHLSAHEINIFVTWTAHLKSKNTGSRGAIISLQIGLLMGWSQDVGCSWWSHPGITGKSFFSQKSPNLAQWHTTKAAQPPSNISQVLGAMRTQLWLLCKHRTSDQRDSTEQEGMASNKGQG